MATKQAAKKRRAFGAIAQLVARLHGMQEVTSSTLVSSTKPNFMSPTLAWIALISAGIFEVVWAYFLKQSDGLTKALPTTLFVASLAISMILLAISVKIIPISIAYPIWTGIGAVGAVLVGAIFFGEALSLLTSIFLMMIIGGIIGLKFFS